MLDWEVQKDCRVGLVLSTIPVFGGGVENNHENYLLRKLVFERRL